MHYLHGSEKLQSSNTTHRGHRSLFPQLQLQMRPSDNLENKTLYQSKYSLFKHTVFQKLHWGNIRTRHISGIERGITTSLHPTNASRHLELWRSYPESDYFQNDMQVENYVVHQNWNFLKRF